MRFIFNMMRAIRHMMMCEERTDRQKDREKRDWRETQGKLMSIFASFTTTFRPGGRDSLCSQTDKKGKKQNSIRLIKTSKLSVLQIRQLWSPQTVTDLRVKTWRGSQHHIYSPEYLKRWHCPRGGTFWSSSWTRTACLMHLFTCLCLLLMLTESTSFLEIRSMSSFWHNKELICRKESSDRNPTKHPFMAKEKQKNHLERGNTSLLRRKIGQFQSEYMNVILPPFRRKVWI